MRWLITAGMIACLGGCESGDPPPPPQLASKPCAEVAQSRMADARANGYGHKDQETAFRYSYADCVKWEAKGYEPPAP
jgi:hypothetical protein